MTDLQTAQELEQLWRLVSDGITRANGVLERSRDIEMAQRDLSALLQQGAEHALVAQRVHSDMKQLSEGVLEKERTIEAMRDAVVSAIAEMGGRLALDLLRREHRNVSASLSTTQQHFQQLEGKVTQVREWLGKLEGEETRAEAMLKRAQELAEAAAAQTSSSEASLQAVLARSQEVEAHAEVVRAIRADIETFGGLSALQAIREGQHSLCAGVQNLTGEVTQLREQFQMLAGRYTRLRKWTVGAGLAAALLMALSVLLPLRPARLDAATAHPAPVAPSPAALARSTPAGHRRHGRRRGTAGRRAVHVAPPHGTMAGGRTMR